MNCQTCQNHSTHLYTINSKTICSGCYAAWLACEGPLRPGHDFKPVIAIRHLYSEVAGEVVEQYERNRCTRCNQFEVRK